MTRDEKFALDFAGLYRARHINVIPSSPEEKKPLYQFAAEYGWDTMFPAEWFTKEAWEARPTTNLQVVLGSAWKLLAVDLDGPEAKKVWDRWVAERGCPRTWMVHREGGDSFHSWFKSPKWWDGPIVKRKVWEDKSVKHSMIEILGDRSLITAPPSRHVKTGGMYRFMKGCSPFDRGLGHPAEAPAWIMNLPGIAPERPKVEFVAQRPKPSSKIVLDREHVGHHDLLDRIPDKIGLARDWGVKFVGSYPPARGWWPCYAVGREEDNPSAAVNIRTGRYIDSGAGHDSLSLFDLMVLSGHAHDWQDAMARLAERYR